MKKDVKIKNLLTQNKEKYILQEVIEMLETLQIMKSPSNIIMDCKPEITILLEVVLLGLNL